MPAKAITAGEALPGRTSGPDAPDFSFLQKNKATMALNQNQKRVLAELMNPATRTQDEIAASCGLATRTVAGYLADDEFNAELNRLLDNVISRANAKLVGIVGAAIDTLQDILESEDTDTTNRRLTAIAILDNMLKLQEIKIVTDRLAKLEKAVFPGER